MSTTELLRELFETYGRVSSIKSTIIHNLKTYCIVFEDPRDADDAFRNLSDSVPFDLSTKTVYAITKSEAVMVIVGKRRYDRPPQPETQSTTKVDDAFIDTILSSKRYTPEQKLKIFAAFA